MYRKVLEVDPFSAMTLSSPATRIQRAMSKEESKKTGRFACVM
jgi:hypothetical protein